ncbi:MAG: hypothetical protein WC648_00660 [Candidatus Paceibacterota bacterium]|jgi:hypothetical protein
MNKTFFSASEMKQPVNQWICIAFMLVFCFWTVLFYSVEKAKDIGNEFIAQGASIDLAN